MYYPAATREDHDPFDVLRIAPTFLQLLGFIHWSTYRCPHCSDVFRTDYWSDSIRLGRGERTCRHCANVFDDGTREWPQLVKRQKRKYFVPTFIVAAGVSLFLAILCVPVILLGDRAYRVAGIVLLVVPLLWWSMRFVWVFLSIRRYNADSR